MFGLNGNGGKSNGAMGYAKQAVTGFAAGFAIDALVEALDVPWLNDVPRGNIGFLSPGGDTGNLSNIEMILYSVSLLLAGGGLYSLLTKKQLFGIPGDMFFFGSSLGAGTSVYESTGSTLLGIRK